MKKLGIKELVKVGLLSSKGAMTRLMAKSDTGIGGTGQEIFIQTRTFKWLLTGKQTKNLI